MRVLFLLFLFGAFSKALFGALGIMSSFIQVVR
jgi:hypothetical protein